MGDQSLDNDHIGISRRFVEGSDDTLQEFIEMPCANQPFRYLQGNGRRGVQRGGRSDEMRGAFRPIVATSGLTDRLVKSDANAVIIEGAEKSK
jgi:hypothetical protein